MDDSPASPAIRLPTSWIDRLCGRFEQSCRNHERPRIEDFLAEVPPSHRKEIFTELLAIEMEIRRSRGEQIDHEEYVRRFPDDEVVIEHVWRGASRAFADTEGFSDPGTNPAAACTATRYAELTLYKRGGLGVLFRARDEELHRDVVIKFIHEKCRAEPELLNQFRIEAEITGRLDHPGVVPVYGIGQDWNGQPFYVMRMIHGRELRQAIQEYHEAGGPANRLRDSRQRLFGLLEHLASACDTVAYAHDVGIVHCDLKPANIMIGKYGETFVLDWGLATSFERTSTFFAADEPTMRPRSADSSQSGQRGGTYGYMSPEQLSSVEHVMPTTDVYSLGATLYEILCGQPPFNGRDPDVADQVRGGRFRRPREVQRRVSHKLEAICLKAMSVAADDRYRTAKLFATDLKNWMRDDELQAAPDKIVGRISRFARRRRGVTIAVFIALLFVTAAGTWAHLSRVHEIEEAELRILVESNFNTALSTFEDLCQPPADGELSNLRVFQPFTRQIQEFADDYLQSFADNVAMRPHTGRVYALRATTARVELFGEASAMADYLRAAAIFESLVSEWPENSDYARRLASVRLSQGRLLLQRGELESAQEALNAADHTLDQLLQGGAGDNSLRRAVAEVNHSLGEVFLQLYGQGVQREALSRADQYFERSRKLREDLFNGAQGAERRNHQRDLARSLGYLGDLHLAEGKIKQARNDYQRSRELRHDLNQQDPNPENRFQDARGLSNFGVLNRDFDGNLTEAMDLLGRALDLQQKLTEQFGEVASFQTDLASTLNLLAEIHLFAAIDNRAGAEQHRNEAGKLAKQAAEYYGQFYDASRSRKQPRSVIAVRGRALSYVLQALAVRASNPAQAANNAVDAAELINDGLGPDETLDAESLFTLAMARSLQNDTDNMHDAWSALRMSVKRGMNAVNRLDKHRTLAFRPLTESAEGESEFESTIKSLLDTVDVALP